MTAKLIFLDIDGVLTSLESRTITDDDMYTKQGNIILSTDSRPLWQREIDLVNLRLVDLACKFTEAKVVISSSWRTRLTLDEFNTWARSLGCMYIDAIAKTPPFAMTANGRQGIRGDEVAAYLEQYRAEQPMYVILDDESQFRKHQYDRLVLCDHNRGYRYDEFVKTLELFEADASTIEYYKCEMIKPRWTNHPPGTKFE